MRDVNEVLGRLEKDPPPTLMTQRYGVWMGRRAEAFPAAAYKHFKKLAEKQR